MKVGYVRVSSKDQNEARQLKAINEIGVDKIYMDKQSGKDFQRAEYQKMIAELKPGDLVLILSIDRLGRNYDEIMAEWRRITKEIKADVKVLDMPLLDTTVGRTNSLTDTFIADLVLQILSYVANLEREHIRERQREGIEIAKAQGKYKGGKKKKIDNDLFIDLLEQYTNGKINKLQFATMLNVSRPTLNRILKEYGED